MTSTKNLSVVIDIGTSKLAGLAGQLNDTGKIEILANAVAPSKGVKRGLIFNIDETANSITNLIDLLEIQLEDVINNVHVSIAGQHVKTVDIKLSHFTSDQGIVSKFDINEIYNEAKKYDIEEGYKIVHVIPQSFLIDGEATELNPVGITGREIEANYKLLTIPEIYLTNLKRVFDKTSVELGEIVLSPLAISEAVLSSDEKEIGGIVLDIGAGTSKVAVYHDNRLIHTAVIPFGGDVISKDIKEGCSIVAKSAEQLKVRYGHALGDFADDQKVVTIPGHSGWEPKEISFKSLAFIIQARMEEIVDSVNYQIEKSGIDGQLGSGIVITGGTSNLKNIISLVKFRTGFDARIAFPVFQPENKKKEFQNHEYLTALGLLKRTLMQSENFSTEKRKKSRKRKEGGGITPLINKFVQGMLDLVDDENEDVAMN